MAEGHERTPSAFAASLDASRARRRAMSASPSPEPRPGEVDSDKTSQAAWLSAQECVLLDVGQDDIENDNSEGPSAEGEIHRHCIVKVRAPGVIGADGITAMVTTRTASTRLG